MKKIIIKKLNKIKLEEEGFKTYWWDNVYFSTSEKEFSSKKINEIEFENLNDEDLIRFFELVLLTKKDISNNRVNEQYFKK